MLKKQLATLLLAMGVIASPAFADDNGWSGEASVTGSKTTGNTETEDLGLGVKLEKQVNVWRHKFNAQADYGEVDDDKNKERWSLGYQLNRDLNERAYIYGNADYFQDSFGAYKDGYFAGAGMGYKVITPEPTGWNLEGGVGYRSQKARGYLDDEVTPNVWVESDRESEVALRGFSDFDYNLNENVSLFNDTEIIWSDSDTYIWNEVGITADLMGNLAARASYRVDYHTDVPPGTDDTDTVARFGVVYTIG